MIGGMSYVVLAPLFAPVNTVAPVVSGTATVGQLLSTTDGTWTGTATITFTYQWQRNNVDIASATASTYTLVNADAGNPIRCVVTGTNGVGNSSANSNSTANVSAIAPGAPTISTATTISDTTATVAFTAPASDGGSTILSYTAISSPGSITGTLTQAGSGTINVTGLSAGVSYTFTVTATNAIGTGAPSAASNSITTFSAPVNTVAPVVSGTATVGQLLSTTNGTWTGTATITFTYQWQRDNIDIVSATSSTYTLVNADAGNPIRCVVTGTNAYGNSSANSNATANVSAIAPGAPTIGTATTTGTTTATVAFTAPASNGGSTILSYTATSTPDSVTGTLTQAGSGTINMTGLTVGTSYTFVVTATNAIGTGAASAASNSITTFSAPANTVAPVVSGTTTVGQTLSTTNGTWSGTATITFTYQWQRNNVDIVSATTSTYTLVAADAGNPIRCVVTGTNAYGNSSANSNSTANVTAIVPGAPTIGTASGTGTTTASVAFTAPASNGGSTILSYTATSTPGNITGTLTQAGSGTINMTGLSSGVSYTFVVTATNAIGTGAASAASNSITTAIPNGSIFFNGTGQYLSVPNSATNQMGTGDWTAEAWLYLVNYDAGINPIIAKGGTTTSWFLGVYSNGRLYFGVNTTDYYRTTGPVVSLNAWHHTVLVRSGTSLITYLDGVRQNTQTGITQNFASTGTLNVGRGRDTSTNYLGGYISNIRLVKGIAVYTTNFSVPTNPFTSTQSANVNGNPSNAITGTETSLLLNTPNNGNYYTDTSSFNNTVTNNGGATSESFNPW